MVVPLHSFYTTYISPETMFHILCPLFPCLFLISLQILQIFKALLCTFTVYFGGPRKMSHVVSWTNSHGYSSFAPLTTTNNTCVHFHSCQSLSLLSREMRPLQNIEATTPFRFLCRHCSGGPWCGHATVTRVSNTTLLQHVVAQNFSLRGAQAPRLERRGSLAKFVLRLCLYYLFKIGFCCLYL